MDDRAAFEEWFKGYVGPLTTTVEKSACWAAWCAARAQSQAEPVAWWVPSFSEPLVGIGPKKPMLWPEAQPLYSRQPAQPEQQDEPSALRLFVGAAYPVSTDIDPRGYRWCEKYLDQALSKARAQPEQQDEASDLY